MLETIGYETHDDHVATVTLNRPDSMNSFNSQMVEEMSVVWQMIKEDDHVHAVVVRAEDGRAFSTGKDVKEVDSSWRDGVVWSQWDPGKKLGPKQNEMWKPIVCAVHGLCCGGAYYWVNESDIVICSEDAEFFDPHVSFGMVSAVEPIGLTRRIAYGEVMRMNLLGNDERMSSATALRIGLVSEVMETREQLWSRARQLAAKIATKPSLATQGTVKAVWQSLDCGLSTALERALLYIQVNNLSDGQVDRQSMKKSPHEVR
ncbi:MAG: enoyl-CoA hydratase/isomerase family protein [Pseudomonadota bacterium]